MLMALGLMALGLMALGLTIGGLLFSLLQIFSPHARALSVLGHGLLLRCHVFLLLGGLLGLGS